ncbi:hypothetical protein D1631_05690 [Chryseobacterium nematophagum]|uniref:Uncharacterized protein n=1 Tax=Chryseobacterium nematophagum TaxID=2305228 RepID=A0A3M7TDA1_9FLAO|nr:hypothetical protein D1631_05690 [Chryseobacterium nematophagum]
MTPPSQKINLGKVFIEYSASALVLLSALLPFANNILGYFIDTSIHFPNSSGKSVLDLDDVIFFLSWPVTLSFLFIGLVFGARLFPKIAVLVSLLIQYVLLIQFIFFDKNNFNIGGLIGSITTFVFLVWGLYKLYIYYTKVLLLDKFKDTTLERFSLILKKKPNL